MSLSDFGNTPDRRLSQYKLGESVVCHIRKPTKNGYTATVNDVDAFLHTKSNLNAGDEVSATVVAISNRLLLTDRPEKFLPTDLRFGSKFAPCGNDQFKPGQVVSCLIKQIDTQGNPFMVVIQGMLFGCHLIPNGNYRNGQTILATVLDCKKGFLTLEAVTED